MNTPRNALVVGISDDGYDSSLGFAVAEARRRGLPLHLVHVLRPPAGAIYTGVYGLQLEAARDTLEQAFSAASELAGDDVSVTAADIHAGWVVDDLVRQSEAAALLVMQHRAYSRGRRLLTGTMVHGVAGRAACPVISVPEGWDPAAETTGTITAAVQDPHEAPALLRSAFEQAQVRGARVRVVHSWWLGSGYDSLALANRSLADEWTARAVRELEDAVAPFRQEFPDVAVEVSVTAAAPPADLLLDAAGTSDLLVIGRRHHLLPLGSHLGPVARAVLDHAPCPVLITPEVPAQTEVVGAKPMDHSPVVL